MSAADVARLETLRTERAVLRATLAALLSRVPRGVQISAPAGASPTLIEVSAADLNTALRLLETLP